MNYALMLLALTPLLLTHVSAARRAYFGGSVVAVVDGDTLRVSSEGREITVQLYGARAPRRQHEFGAEAASVLAELSLGREVGILPRGDGPYHSVVGEVFLPDGTHLSREMILRGLAWWDEPHAPGEAALRSMEREARGRRAGLWMAMGRKP